MDTDSQSNDSLYYRTSDSQIADENFSNNRRPSGFSTTYSTQDRLIAREEAFFKHIQDNNPYIGTPFEDEYNNILSHYNLLILEAESNKKWYEQLGLSRYTEQLITQYKNDMYSELRALESTYTFYSNSLPSTVVDLQNSAGLNSDLIGLQYSGGSASSGGSGSTVPRSSSLPSSSPAHEALSMGLAMIGSLTDFATNKVPGLVSQLGAIRGISLDNDIKKQQLHTTHFNNFALENEYLREFALNNFGGVSDESFNKTLTDLGSMNMPQLRELSDLPQFLDDDRAYKYLLQYMTSDAFNTDYETYKNVGLKAMKENAFLTEVYGSDFNMMSDFYKEIGSMVRELEKVTARYNLEQATYDLNTASDTIHADVDAEGNLVYTTPDNNVALDPETAVNAVNIGNERSYFQNKFEGEVKEVMSSYTDKWSKKADSDDWWSWIYDVMIMAMPYFISGLGSGTISLFRGGSTINNTTYSNSNTTNTGPTEITSNRYFNGMSQSY